MAAKILLLGATGFIGKNLHKAFLLDSRYVIYAPARSELNLLDALSCKNYLNFLRPDFVIHSAVDITSTERSLQAFFNILNNHDLFGHLVQIGSGAEYDRQSCGPMVTEEAFGRSVPTDTYGLAKYLIARELQSSHVGRATNFRLFGIFGVHEDYSRRFISNNIVRVLSGLPISLNQDMLFDYIDVDDFCKFLLDSLLALPFNEVSYNFCRGEPTTLLCIAEMLQRKMSPIGEIVIKNHGMRSEYTGSPSKLFTERGTYKFISMSESVDSLISFYRASLSKEFLAFFFESHNV